MLQLTILLASVDSCLTLIQSQLPNIWMGMQLEVVMIVSLSALGMIALLIGIFILIIMPDDLQWKLSHRHPFRRQVKQSS